MSGILVNTSRGESVDQAVLIRVLDSGHRSGAALDVFDPEPSPADNPFYKMENVVATPHMASSTVDSSFRSSTGVVDQILSVIQGKQPEWLVDQCVAQARIQPHPEIADKTVWEVFEAERASLVPYRGSFDGFPAVQASVSRTCLVRFDSDEDRETTHRQRRFRHCRSNGHVAGAFDKVPRLRHLHGPDGQFSIGAGHADVVCDHVDVATGAVVPG